MILLFLPTEGQPSTPHLQLAIGAGGSGISLASAGSRSCII